MLISLANYRAKQLFGIGKDCVRDSCKCIIPSYSHQGFSPVNADWKGIGNRFNGFSALV